MHSSDITPSPPSPNPPPRGLPPVQPPSGQMILRMFLVPGLLVAVLVLLFLAGPVCYRWIQGLFGVQPGDSRTADQYLREMDSDNADRRWRAASDLAQNLLRDDRLASNGHFAIKLADRLQQALTSSADAEKSFAERVGKMSAKEKANALKQLDPERIYIQYLTACLGNFMVPVGVPLLEQMAEQEKGLDPKTLTLRRRKAVFALATLGQNLSRFDKLSDEEKNAVEKGLDEAIQQKDHADWAQKTRDYLEKRRAGKADALGVDKTLQSCAQADDPFLRKLTAFALNFWTGTPAENARMEATLLKLTHDDGRGEDDPGVLADEDKSETESVVKRPGYQIQANATVALARRGSTQVPMGMLKEMLDPEVLRQRFVVRQKNGAERPDEAVVVVTLIDTLKAVAELHRKAPQKDLSRLLPLIDKLAQDPNRAIQLQAAETKQALEAK